MLKLGVISDTHWSSLAQASAGAHKLINGVFANVDAIIHAGDMLHPEIDLAFAPYKFYAVRGNMDAAGAHTPLKRILTFDGIRIGVIHGWGGGAEIEANAAREFDLEKIDLLIYGHSHYPACHVEDQVLFLNPGSAAERRRAPYHSVGLIRICAVDPVADAGNGDHYSERDNKKYEIGSTEQGETWPVEARQVLQCGAQQQVIAEIINVDAVSEIV